MKKSILILTIFLAFAFGLSMKARASTISGRVIDGQGYTIRLMTHSDQVSFLRETLQSTVIGEDEKFYMTYEPGSVKYCWLDIEFQQAGIFIQPGQNYEVELEMKNQSLSASYYNRTDLPVRFIKDDDDHLNLSIQDFNQLYNDFLLNYAEKGQSGNPKTVYETFIKAIEIRFQKNNNSYFKDYIRYKTASMQLFMRLKGRDKIGLEYFAGQPVLYENLEYMDFFRLFFEKYFLISGKYISYNKTYDLVNGNASSGDIIDSLEADPVLKDVEIRELLLLDGLKELYHVSGFKQDRVMLLINEISGNGSTAGIRKVADNIQVRLKRLQPGNPAPDFNLPGITIDKTYNLAGFSGKYIYLAFFDSGNPASQSELGMIGDLYREYGDKVEFVAISVDKDLSRLEDYLSRADLPWLMLHYDGNLELLENYDASTFPHFLLIDDKGRIVRCPAPSPSENIQKLFGSI